MVSIHVWISRQTTRGILRGQRQSTDCRCYPFQSNTDWFPLVVKTNHNTLEHTNSKLDFVQKYNSWAVRKAVQLLTRRRGSTEINRVNNEGDRDLECQSNRDASLPALQRSAMSIETRCVHPSTPAECNANYTAR